MAEAERYMKRISGILQYVWKKATQGVREMCDVCQTALFNFHWTCKSCGLVACADCHKTQRAAKSLNNWPYCTLQKELVHKLDEMMMTVIIPGNDLRYMHQLVHTHREQEGITQSCGCQETNKSNKESNTEENESRSNSKVRI